MSKKRKRISRRRLAGQRVLAHVPTFHLETGEHKPVTAARRYLAEGGITPPALLRVRRNEHTTDHFFWGEKGLFSAQYAEENHFLFPSLRSIVDKVGEEVTSKAWSWPPMIGRKWKSTNTPSSEAALRRFDAES